ncbi:hypothetical protein GT3570_09860 [Geobacillus thermoleovorans]|uniref:3-oxoacyl-[acyl-carrier-protein] synthase III C-terminal domain-containing protein n=1 Tax=Geobacillus TaxID=129337 RepID=UPI00078CC9AA|nr:MULTISPECIES: 3-oxoacyl-[acyl-carrier-protein] synthase III C-terminal domain-containing protein [Geobacillus]AMV11234.1 hypothetical protein GT3570_09860 [Geobacillus thermoleovorans]OPX02802.1 hypothetical protein B1A75_11290 [Geobacillus sp. LEMMY01]TLS34688.1 hypothetical protein FDK15_01020 [Geobacillus thermoleovorans]
MKHQAHVAIAGAGFYVPPRVVTNNDLSQRLETDDEWIVQRTGIRQRYRVEESVTTTEMIESAAKKGGYPFEKFFLNVDRYGNTSAASIPIALTESLQQKAVREWDLVAMIGFGGGLTWGIHVLSVYAR